MTIAADPIDGHGHGNAEPGGSKALAWGVLIVAILAITVGGWLAWTKVFAGPSESGELDVGNISDRYRPRAFIAARPQPAPVQQDGIRPTGANMYRIQSGEFFMALAPTETTYAPTELRVRPRAVVTAEENQLMRFCTDVGNAGIAHNLDVTPDQAKQLTAIRQHMPSGMKISEDDRNKLRDLWKNWNGAKDAAAKSAAQAALLNAMKDIGNRSIGPTKQEYADVANQIRKIVTAQQLAKFRQLRGG